MDAIIAGLQSLIITVKKNAWSSILTTVLLLVLIITWSARDNIATFIERNPSAAQEKDRFDKSVQADAQINETLVNIQTSLNADRVMIRQFHNSKADLTGLPFASISTTYFALAPGVAISENSMNAYPLSTVNETLVKMFVRNHDPVCAVMRTSEIHDPIFTKFLNESGVAVGYSCPLNNLRGQPVGMIWAVYLTDEKKRPSDEDIMAILNDTGMRVVGYLSGVIVSENTPWYSIFWKDTEKESMSNDIPSN
jgi:hypothetical protein